MQMGINVAHIILFRGQISSFIMFQHYILLELLLWTPSVHNTALRPCIYLLLDLNTIKFLYIFMNCSTSYEPYSLRAGLYHLQQQQQQQNNTLKAPDRSELFLHGLTDKSDSTHFQFSHLKNQQKPVIPQQQYTRFSVYEYKFTYTADLN